MFGSHGCGINSNDSRKFVVALIARQDLLRGSAARRGCREKWVYFAIFSQLRFYILLNIARPHESYSIPARLVVKQTKNSNGATG